MVSEELIARVSPTPCASGKHPAVLRQRSYFVVVPAGAGFDADVDDGGGDAGFSQQEWTLALRLSGAFGSMVPFRTTHLNVA